jgi:hemerythrin superfamily protein
MSVDIWQTIINQHRVLLRRVDEMFFLLASDRTSFHLYMEAVTGFFEKVHAKIEDDVIFPFLVASKEVSAVTATDKDETNRFINRLKADHRLISTLGYTIGQRGRGYSEQILRERLQQFKTILEGHINSEEQLYVHAKEIHMGRQTVESMAQQIRGIILVYGTEKYVDIMGGVKEDKPS